MSKSKKALSENITKPSAENILSLESMLALPDRELENLSDESLCRLSAAGRRMAEETLAIRYYRLVRICARPYCLVGGDSEDLIQEGMLGLIKAIREYHPSREASFRTYAEVCVRNRLYSVLRRAARDKHRPLNQSVPLDTFFLAQESYTSGICSLAERDPEEYLIDREYTAALLSEVQKQLSELEAKILCYYLEGLSCREIAAAVGKPPKSVDNALQRIRRKVARHLPAPT